MKFSNIINLTSVLAMVLGNSNSEQSEGPIVLGNYIPMTSQKNQPKSPYEEETKLALAALSLLLVNETLKNKKNIENEENNKVREFQKFSYQPPPAYLGI